MVIYNSIVKLYYYFYVSVCMQERDGGEKT